MHLRVRLIQRKDFPILFYTIFRFSHPFIRRVFVRRR